MKKIISLLISVLMLASMVYTANAMPRNSSKRNKGGETTIIFSEKQKRRYSGCLSCFSKRGGYEYIKSYEDYERESTPENEYKNEYDYFQTKRTAMEKDSDLSVDKSESPVVIEWDIYSYRREVQGDDYKLIKDMI